MSLWPPTGLILSQATPVIRQFEGFMAKPYICPAGVPTIGFGTTRYPDGRKVSLADPACTMSQALTWLDASATRVLADLQRPGIVTRFVGIDEAAALLCLAYNIGVGVKDGIGGDLADSTLLRKFNAGDYQGAADQFLVWNKARVKGVLTALPGLTRRRQVERALFLRPVTQMPIAA